MTTVYLVRHAEPFKIYRGIEEIDEELLFSNIKTPLSVNGERCAEEKSMADEFKNIDVIWSSDYVRCMSTAKWFAYRNNLKVNISDKLGERKHGVNSWDELPSDFEVHQFEDENYKIGNGESRKEVSQRLYNKIMDIINENKNKRILIVGHSTAFAYLFSNWCKVSYDSDYKFNNEVFFDGKWEFLETFKLMFDDNNKLIDIFNVK